METKTEQQTDNPRAARLAELTERAKRVAEEIHAEVCAVNRWPKATPYVSVAKMFYGPNINVQVGMFDESMDSVGEIIAAIEAFNPEDEKQKQIAELEAKLAKLKGVAA